MDNTYDYVCLLLKIFRHSWQAIYHFRIFSSIYCYVSVWWPGLNNSPTVTHACFTRRLTWVPSAWGYSRTTLSPGITNTETWSSRLGVGPWTNNPAPKKRLLLRNQKGRPGPEFGCRAIWWFTITSLAENSTTLVFLYRWLCRIGSKQ
jgi:hypothetical protein